jgi:hypothetical protein
VEHSDSGIDGPSYTFSYTVEAIAHSIAEEAVPSNKPGHKEGSSRPPTLTPVDISGESIPLRAFAHASTMQAACRYLVDIRGLSFTAAAKLLGRNPKSVWASYQQAAPLPDAHALPAEPISIPVEIFRGTRSPLEALVCYLREQGMRNKHVAAALGLDPRTTSTAARRGEARR